MPRASLFSFEYFTEILSSPLVKPLAQRLHPSAVTAALKGVFDDVSREFRGVVNEQRLPDVATLVDKVVERLRKALEDSEPLAIDARGRLFPNQLERLADVALHERVWVAAEPRTELSARQEERLRKSVPAKLARLAGSDSALVFPNVEAARVALLQRLYESDRELLVARRDMFERENRERLEDSLRIFPHLRRVEIGAGSAVDLTDYEEGATQETGLVWRSVDRASSEGRFVDSETIAKLKGTKGRDFLIVEDVEFAPIVDLDKYFYSSTPTVGKRLKSGADIVLCDGAQLIGGPNCGLLFGPKEALDALKTTAACRLAVVDRTTLAALSKTLELYETPDLAFASIPALKILTASIANLENRAKRLAEILETFPQVQIARVVEGRSILCVNALFGAFPTRLVELRPRAVSPAELAALLEKGAPRLLARWTRDSLFLDMRTLPPELDLVVAEIFEKLDLPREENAAAKNNNVPS